AQWWHVVEFALHTGMRQSEQFTLRWEFVDFQTRMLKIPRSKSGKARHVPLKDLAIGILTKLQSSNASNSPWVFKGQGSRGGQNHLSANWFCRAILTPALKQAGFDNFC